MKARCSWSTINEEMIAYHDTEWGTPCHDDRTLFEYILLDSFQAGLSWAIILSKRGNFRKAFDNFNPQKIAKYDVRKMAKLLLDRGIVRNRLKIKATVRNAQVFVAIQKEFGSFDRYLWEFVGGKTKKNAWKSLKQIPSTTKEAKVLSKDLKKRGFAFFGPTTCYAFMQGAGLVNDHLVTCFRHKEVAL